MGASETPPFWWQKADWRALALAPAAALYARTTRISLSRPARLTVDVPILRIADFAVAVPGKTQAAMAVARAAKKHGHRPGILFPGPAGFGAAPHLVDPKHDSARHVGDAAIEAASAAPVAVASDHAAAARMLAAEGCDFLISVDGPNAWRLKTHFTLRVIDAERGLGNERVMPAGPLRGRLTDLARASDAILRIGDTAGANAAVRAAARAAKPVHTARTVIRNRNAIAGSTVIALSTVKHVDGFAGSLERAGASVVDAHTFAESHHFMAEDYETILEEVVERNARIVTTGRDMIRLAGGEPPPPEFLERLDVLQISVEFEVEATGLAIIRDTIAAWRQGRPA